MSENSIGRTINIIGIVTFIIGIIGSFICGIALNSWSIAIIGSVASFISGMCFVGFSEIISLLQRNVNKQDEIIKILEEQPKSSDVQNSAPKMIIQDIESNLPEMWGDIYEQKNWNFI